MRRILGCNHYPVDTAGTTSAHAENTRSRTGWRLPPGNYLRVRGEYSPGVTFHYGAPELPPHARRIPHPIAVGGAVHGTTSACAENTSTFAKNSSMGRNYLHIRGEYGFYRFHPIGIVELPPRARRIQIKGLKLIVGRGTTSACAENTELFVNPIIDYWNYLRVRGEYRDFFVDVSEGLELPPRARRILGLVKLGGCGIGTTSACAENTKPLVVNDIFIRNYLRVRGEYGIISASMCSSVELPPRARRIRIILECYPGEGGTTSACAENTPLEGAPYVWGGNYLRVRGEYRQPGRIISNIAELPPRARRIRDSLDDLGLGQGTTSACAENTTDDPRYMQRSRNYLRVRGEYVRHVQPVESCEELPPRARRIPITNPQPSPCGGTTSACAENTL